MASPTALARRRASAEKGSAAADMATARPDRVGSAAEERARSVGAAAAEVADAHDEREHADLDRRPA